MKIGFSIALLIILLPPFVTADAPVKTIKSKEHSCVELRDIVKKEQKVYMKGLGALYVYADRNESCSDNRKCKSGLVYCEPFQTNWRTSDKRFCSVGHSCKVIADRDFD